MTAATADRRTIIKPGDEIALPVKGATKIYAGTMVQRDSSGLGVPASATIANKTVGIAERQADNSGGADSAINVVALRRRVGIFANSASGDLIAQADVGNDCYVVDDSTVAKTDNSGARPKAGTILGVDSQGVHVLVGA